MNPSQLAVRTAAHQRDYAAINALFDAGTTAADCMHAVMRNVARDDDEQLLELLLCSAPAGLDLDGAIAIEKNLRRGLRGLEANEVAAMRIRTAFLKKILVDQRLQDLEPAAA
jgi:hypothetical protein